MAEERGPEGREGQTGREGAKGREGIPGIAGAIGPEGPKGKTGNTISRPIKVAFIAVTLLFFLTLAGFAWVINDIQNSRESSCRQTYNGIREVFRPFFPEPPRTKEQQADLDKFNNTIDRLMSGCSKQINGKG